MRSRALTRIVSTSMLMAAVLGSAPASAQDAGEAMPLPCTGELYDFTPAGPITDFAYVRGTEGGQYHEVAIFAVTVSAVPDDGSGVTYMGRITFIHTANDGLHGPGHAISTFMARAVLHGLDGSLLRAHTLAHISATARPDLDPSALIRVFFEHNTCN